jgi:YesN/AraC family two-component response regulator
MEGLHVVINTLKSSELRLSVAHDGGAGLSLAAAVVPDLILLDVDLPRINGSSVCRLLKQNPHSESIPILLLGSSGDPDAIVAGMRDGAAGYILGPYRMDDVLMRVRAQLIWSLSAHVMPFDSGAPYTSDDELLVRSVRYYLLARIAETRSLEGLTQFFSVSEKRLSRAFRQFLGCTVFEYLRQERIRMAQRLLTETSQGIAAVAEQVGFDNAGNFSTAFRVRVGQSPSVFRRKALIEKANRRSKLFP